ncbi:MAG: DNA alkylation repair protein [Cardiobacteriaceae bacterium]|nr:DNA alkylation repair protein [Cardiobacteriaceae bacterium]
MNPALVRGECASRTLAEITALDQAQLARHVFPNLPADAHDAIADACRLGILKRMQGIAAILLNKLSAQEILRCQTHPSDTVRGWGCFIIGAQTMTLEARLAAIRPFADDAHFGVREWAWMAVRPHLAAELDHAIALLTPWTQAEAAYLRRFACEALRPRGVWSAHIAALKDAPQRALPLLDALRADPERYVQDSVANWLNDAAKSQPQWVQDVCRDWLRDSASPATRYICRRALRNLSITQGELYDLLSR